MGRLPIKGVLVAFFVAATFSYGVRRFRQVRLRRHEDRLLDLSIDGTFPASDPPASQYFGTPVNRS